MAFPTSTYRSEFGATELGHTTLKEIDTFAALNQGFLSKEHKADGTHGDVTADTVTAGVGTFEELNSDTGTLTGTVVGQADLAGFRPPPPPPHPL